MTTERTPLAVDHDRILRESKVTRERESAFWLRMSADDCEVLQVILSRAVVASRALANSPQASQETTANRSGVETGTAETSSSSVGRGAGPAQEPVAWRPMGSSAYQWVVGQPSEMDLSIYREDGIEYAYASPPMAQPPDLIRATRSAEDGPVTVTPSGGTKADSATALRAARRRAISECQDAIGSRIIPGPLPGNGLDETAQRNGLVMAYNLLGELGANSPSDPQMTTAGRAGASSGQSETKSVGAPAGVPPEVLSEELAVSRKNMGAAAAMYRARKGCSLKEAADAVRTALAAAQTQDKG